jgi:hemin uptake protein HemP
LPKRNIPPGPTPDAPSAAADAPATLPRVTSRELFGAASVLLIDHEGETYSLRRTRLGKLILTK